MDNENKRFYLKIRGQEVEVSEEVYREYKRPDRAERKRKQRMWRCLIPREKASKSFLKRCMHDCSKCPYGRQAKNSVVSLDTLKDSGYEEEDIKQDPERNYLAEEERQELYAAIKQLSPRQQELVRLVYFVGMTQEEARKRVGIAKSSMSEAMQRIHTTLRQVLEKN